MMAFALLRGWLFWRVKRLRLPYEMKKAPSRSHERTVSLTSKHPTELP